MFIFALMPLFLFLFGYYIGRRGWQWLKSMVPRPSRLLYWTVFWLLALSFPLARVAERSAPMAVGRLLAAISGYWLGLFVYALLLLVLIDLIRLLNRWLHFMPSRPDLTKWTGIAVIVLLAGLMVYGTWRARTPVVTEYNIAIPKAAGQYKALNVVLVSDTHLGYVVGNERIRQLVSMVNGLNPDLVLVAGDIIDDDLRPFLAENMAAGLSQIKPKIGTYAVLGNHDAGSEDLPAFRNTMAKAGIQLLVDQWVKIDDSFYVVGRNDSSQGRRRSGGQVPLEQILKGVDPQRPILLMDHQPNRLADAEAAGVDLQVSGHTHRGQIFPGNLITSRVFAVDWGLLKRAATNFIVSDGFGTWGPPIRIGNRPEVVDIHVTFGQ